MAVSAGGAYAQCALLRLRGCWTTLDLKATRRVSCKQSRHTHVINPKRNQLRYQLGNPRERLMFIDYIEEGLVSITVLQWHGRGDKKEGGTCGTELGTAPIENE